MVPDEVLKDIESFDKKCEDWLKKNPGKKFSDFSTNWTENGLKAGNKHATLGSNLKSGHDFLKSGLTQANYVLDMFRSKPEDKICEYGCGSLRVGVHFIKRQESGNFYGIDVNKFFIDEGIKLCGDELIEAKKPVLGTIESYLDEVVSSGVDMTYALNVQCHIHPDEVSEFTDNLHKICWKNGSTLILHVLVWPEPLRYQRSGWAWPLHTYIDWMSPMKLVSTKELSPAIKHGEKIQSFLLKFVR